MSRGPGSAQRLILQALRSTEAPFTVDELARAVLGERSVVRVHVRRRITVIVPDGDVSNFRRALDGLARRGRVVAVFDKSVPDQPRRTRSSTRYVLSDCFTFHSGVVRAAPGASAPSDSHGMPGTLGKKRMP
jgi:hypothetical protein